MNAIDHDNPAYRRARAQLADEIRKLAAVDKTRKNNGDAVVHVEVPLSDIDLLSWQAAQVQNEKLYWHNREHSLEIAGLGTADVITVETDEEYPPILKRARGQQADGQQRVRHFGGFQFDGHSNRQDECWTVFGRGRLVLPRFEIVNENGRTHFGCNIMPHEINDATIDRIVGQLNRLVPPCDAPPSENSIHITHRTDTPDRHGWQNGVSAVLDAIDHGKVQKVVLARRIDIMLSCAPDPWHILRLLRESTESCTLFAFQPPDGPAFLGATPERLYARKERRLQTEALAGTRARGTDPHEDKRLADELAASKKEQREHRFVLDSIIETLQTLCDKIETDDKPAVLKLARVQHLRSAVEARLLDGVTDGDLLAALHPTPAVGGLPGDVAPDYIRQAESFDRGWYAGPVGWIGADAAEFVVAIRSALIAGNHLILFAGAGIVEGSIAASEWEETENKISHFIDTVIDRP